MPEPASDPTAAARVRPPGTVGAAAILLAIGAVQAVGLAFSGSAESGSEILGMLPWWSQLLYGLMYVVLVWGVWTGRPWARILVLVLCGVGAALAVLDLLQANTSAGLSGLIWPVVFVILLNTVKAREWFGIRTPIESANPDSAT